MRSVEAGPPTEVDEAKIARIAQSLQSLNRGVSVRVDEGRRKTVDFRFLAGSALLLAVPATAQDRGSPASTAAAVAAEPLPILPAPTADARLPVVEPIITNDEFLQSIPPLGPDDPALSQPLESIEQFEQRLLGQPVGNAPAITGPSPAIFNDPELSAPLPPLASFDVREVELADPGPSVAASEIRYAIRVDGLDHADAATDSSMRGLFDSLSVLRGGKGHATSQAMLSARLTEDSKLLQRILHAEGWYDVSVETRIDPAVAVGQPLGAVLVVTPGQRYSIATITVTADPTVPPHLIEDSLALKVGEPIVADRVQGAEANVALVLPQQGYPFATVNQRDILLDPETHVGDYTLPVTIGPRGRFGAFQTKGDLAFGADHVAVLARFKPGDLYDSRKVDDLRKALVATGLFRPSRLSRNRAG
jgi:translocation and assembly module TamA